MLSIVFAAGAHYVLMDFRHRVLSCQISKSFKANEVTEDQFTPFKAGNPLPYDRQKCITLQPHKYYGFIFFYVHNFLNLYLMQ